MTVRTIAAFMLCTLLGFGQATVARAASKAEIDAKVQEAVQEFYKQTSAGKQLAQKAAGMLVFPEVIKAGIGVGGEYGEGALLIKGKTAG